MAWITPIVNWIASNVLTPTDLNRIEGNTQDLKDNKVDKVAGKQLSTEDYTTVEKNKLDEIQAGAQVNVVTSVAGRTGDVAVSKSDVGLGSVLNYGIATQAEAEAGTSDVKYMTPLKVKQLLDVVGVVLPGSKSVPIYNLDANYFYNAVLPLRETISPNSPNVWRKALYVNIFAPGVYRTVYKLAGIRTFEVQGRIYRNGSPYGTVRSCPAGSSIIFEEDLFFDAGDQLQIYGNAAGENSDYLSTHEIGLKVVNPGIVGFVYGDSAI